LPQFWAQSTYLGWLAPQSIAIGAVLQPLLQL